MEETRKLPLSGVILAGGKNRRMGGKHKALLPFDGIPLIQRQVRIMERICSEVILVTNDPPLFLPILENRTRIITDYFSGFGPLGGMHAALSLAQYTDVWVVACDMPFLSDRAAEYMFQRKKKRSSNAVMPVIHRQLHPFHSIYDQRCLKPIKDLIAVNDSRVDAFVRSIAVDRVEEAQFQEWGLDPSFVFNVNTPDDYEEALQLDVRHSHP